MDQKLRVLLALAGSRAKPGWLLARQGPFSLGPRSDAFAAAVHDGRSREVKEGSVEARQMIRWRFRRSE